MISSPIGSARHVGRETEQRFLRELFGQVRKSGEGAAVLVEGEAGAGKTRLLRDFHAELDDAASLTLRPLEYASEPFAPFYLAVSALDQRDGAVARAAASLAPDAQVPKARRFADIRALVRDLTRRRPLAISFDDLHWADDASVELLRFLIEDASETPVFFALTSRPNAGEERLRGFSHRLHHLALRPLSDADILELLREALRGRGELDVGRLRRLSALAEGNPFLAEELLRNALSGADDIAPSVQNAVLARFASLGTEAQTALRFAALLERVDVGALSELTGRAAGLIVDALDGAARADLVGRQGGGWQFLHALTREAIAASIPAGERRRLHADIARHLETRMPDSFAIGDHWWEASQPQRAAEANERSGDLAFAAHAYSDAATRYGRALGAHAGDARALREKLGVALIKSGDAVAARPHLLQARAAAEAAGDVEQVCSCDLSLSFVRWTEGDCDEAVSIARRALARLRGSAPGTLHFRLAVRVAMASQIKGDESAARAALDEARLLYELGDTDTRIAFCNTEAMLKASIWDSDGCVAAYRRALALAEEHENSELFASTLNNLGLNAVLLGRPDVALPALREGLAKAYAGGLRRHVGNTALTLARAHYLFGSLTEAREALLDAVSARYDAPTRAMAFAGYGIPIALALRDEELLGICAREEALDQALETSLAHLIGPVVDAFVQLYDWQQRSDEIGPLLERALRCLSGGERPLFALPHVARYGPENALAGARRLLEAPPFDRVRCAERALFDAYAAKRAGDRVAAKRHAAQAARLYRAQSWPLLAAQALAVAGRTAEARELRRSAGAFDDAPAPGGVLALLSPREREIAELAIEGSSSREIARRLHLSERTVSNHLQSAFNRLGIGNRRELAKLSNSEARPK